MCFLMVFILFSNIVITSYSFDMYLLLFAVVMLVFKIVLVALFVFLKG